jgi:hypothetical protein
MKPTTKNPTNRGSLTMRWVTAATVVLLGTGAIAACSSTDATGATQSTSTTAGASSGSSSQQVLPVTSNPINNSSTAQTLQIDQVLVENNVSPITNKAADDHLEITLTNTGDSELGGFEVYTTYTDPTAKLSESYYTKLPSSFTIAPGATRVAHFDNLGELDHFAVNDYSVYATSKNALDVEVVVSADGAAVQTATAKKDPGGAENPAE